MMYAAMPYLDIPTPARPATAGTALPWPPSGRQSAWKPTGGFFQCPTPYLTLPWALYQHGHLSFLALRTWFGILELPERRHDCVRDREVHYSVEELRRLLQVPRLAPVQTALHRLEAVGLLAWSSARIVCFPDPEALGGQDLPAYQTVQAQLPPWRTWMPAPRRLLRWLAREGTPGLCATAAGVLLRCLWSQGRRCVSGGRVAARWIASGFGVAERTVHRALEDLQACGWLARFPSRTPADAAQERRYGARTVINLRWDPPVPDTVASPPTAEAATATVRPRAGRSTCGTSGQDQTVKHSVTQGGVVEHIVKHVDIPDQNVSPLPGAFNQNVSPTPPAPVPLSPIKSSDSTPSSGVDLYPFQEETPDPVPALTRAREIEHTGISYETHDEDYDTNVLPTAPVHIHSTTLPADLSADVLAAMPIAMPVEMPPTMSAETPMAVPPATCADISSAVSAAAPAPAPPARSPFADPAALFAAMPAAEQEEHLRAARERLLAQDFAAALLIRPALLANVYTHLVSSGDAPLCPVKTPAASASPVPTAGSPCGNASDAPVRPAAAPGMWAAAAAVPRRLPQDTPSAALSPAVQPETALPGAAPPSLRHVVPTDLHDRARLEALRQQAITWRWLTGSEADRLTFATAAVHARRVGSDPCALFVAIVREQRWEVLTDGDEDQARALLRGPQPASAPPRAAATPAPACSDDARLVRLVLSILRQDGWSGDPFVAMQQHYPAWTWARWDAALAEALGRRRVGRGLERLGRGLEGVE